MYNTIAYEFVIKVGDSGNFCSYVCFRNLLFMGKHMHDT